jgi:transposase-like protein
MRKRTTYSKEFKLEAVRLLEASNRPAAEVARELGIRRNQLYKWQEALRAEGDQAFPGSGKHSDASKELGRLKRENARLKEEIEILKKAAIYFAKQNP